MPDTYYLIDKNKEREYQKFEEFWINTLAPEIENLLSEYATRRKKEKPNLSETIDKIIWIGKRAIDFPSFCPLTDELYVQRVGTTHYNEKIKFVFATWDTNITGEKIGSVDQLKSFLEEHPEIYIADVYGSAVQLEDFLKETGLQTKEDVNETN